MFETRNETFANYDKSKLLFDFPKIFKLVFQERNNTSELFQI